MAGSQSVISVTITGDASGLDKATTSASQSVSKMSTDTTKSVKTFSDSVAGSGKTFKGVTDLSRGLSDGLGVLGINLPLDQFTDIGRAGNDLAKAFKDLIGPAVEKVKAQFGEQTAATEEATVATDAQTEATTELGAATEEASDEAFGPWGLVIGAVAIGLYELYEHVAPFRDAVNDVAKVLKDVVIVAFKGFQTVVSDTISFIGDHWKLILGIITGPIGAAVIFVASHWDTIKNGAKTVVSEISGFFSGLGGDIQDAFKGALDFVIGGINDVIHAINSADSVSVFGHRIGPPSIPDIPRLATGGSLVAGQVTLVGENGPELLLSNTGGTVMNATQTSTALGGGEHVRVMSGGQDITQFVTAIITSRDAATKRAALAGSSRRTG